MELKEFKREITENREMPIILFDKFQEFCKSLDVHS